MKLTNLALLNITVFLKSQSYLLPVMLLFYIQNGLTTADFFFFQGIVCFVELLFGLPSGWLADYFSKKTVLLFSYAMLFLRYALWLFFGGYAIILAGEICYAVYKSLFQSTAEGYIYQYLCENDEQKRNLSKYSYFNAAASFGSALSAVIGALLFKENGITIVLIVQICIVSLGILLLCFIKPVRKAEYKKQGIRRSLVSFTELALKLKNSNLKFYIAISGIFAATTSLLLNTFQPLMHLGSVPVLFFGGIYFLNHITRAFSGLYTYKILSLISLRKLGLISYIANISVFLVMYLIIKNNFNFLIVPLLIIACLCIAVQLSFNIGIVSLLQKHTKIGNRSMMASFNNTFIRVASGLILVLNTYFVQNFGLLYEPVLGILFIGGTIFLLQNLPDRRN